MINATIPTPKSQYPIDLPDCDYGFTGEEYY